MNITDFIPEKSLRLVKYSGDQLIDRLGFEVIKNVVISILSGRNVRDLTEGSAKNIADEYFCYNNIFKIDVT